MKKKHLIYFTIVFIISCTNDSENDLIDNTPLPSIVTYTNTVKSIIDNNCLDCHINPPINDAPMSLLTYDNVKEAVENRNLIGRISSQDLSFVMPFGGPRLPQNLIDAVIQWEENGLLEEE